VLIQYPKSRPAALVVIGCILLAAGCGKPTVIEPPRPVNVAIEVGASPAANPDAGGRPSPTAVRVYQLADGAAFAEADLNSLWTAEATLLGATLIARQEFLVAPGATEQAKLTLDPATRLIGVAAAFRDFRSATWRVTKTLPQGASAPTEFTLNISLEARSLSADLQPRVTAEVQK
jgi:type VI secretion system protein VasD